MKSILMPITLGLTLALFTGCESDERKAIFASQLCIDQLDTATSNINLSTQVDSCVAPLANYSSQEALVLKCSASFLSGGLSEDKLIQAITDLDEGESSGQDPTATAMETLSYGQDPADKVAAAETLQKCQDSKSSSLIGLAGLVNISTIIDGVAGGAGIPDLLDDFQSDDMTTEEKVDLANTILDSQESLCDPESGLLSGEEMCEDLNAAVEANGGDSLTEAQKQQMINDFMSNLDPENS